MLTFGFSMKHFFSGFHHTNDKKKKGHFDDFVNSIEFAETLCAVFDESYDGGDFCQGLIFSRESSKIMTMVGDAFMRFNAPKEQKSDKPKL